MCLYWREQQVSCLLLRCKQVALFATGPHRATLYFASSTGEHLLRPAAVRKIKSFSYQQLYAKVCPALMMLGRHHSVYMLQALRPSLMTGCFGIQEYITIKLHAAASHRSKSL